MRQGSRVGGHGSGELLAILLLVAGCESAERRNAASVLAAVQRYRSADNASTPAMVDALKTTPCSAPDVCETRDACASAGEATSQALRLKSDVERALGQLESGAMSKDSAEAQALPKKLDEAEALLKVGHQRLPKCDEAVQALKRKHRL